MFGLFNKDPTAKLHREYNRLLKEARDTQRGGDVVGAARLTARAEEVLRKIEEAEAAANA